MVSGESFCGQCVRVLGSKSRLWGVNVSGCEGSAALRAEIGISVGS